MKKHSRNGFTVIELLTVMTIMVIIGYSVTVLVRQVVISYTRVQASQEILDTARTIMQRLSLDVGNTFITRTDTRFTFTGTSTALDFNALLEVAAGTSRVVEIGYSCDVNDQLIRRYDDNDIPDQVNSGGRSDVVARGVRSLQFQFYYRDNSGVHHYTGEDWDSRVEHFDNYSYRGEPKSPDGLPDAVAVTFSLIDFNEVCPEKQFQTTIYLPQNKYY